MKFILALLCCLSLSACSGSKPSVVTIQSDGNKMAYLTKEFTVKVNQEISLIMDNVATIPVMKHNVVILTDESKVAEIGRLAMSAPNYLPEHPAILAATAIAGAGEKTEITFTAPSKPGKYVFICTFPGHCNIMKGYMIVES